MKERAELRVEEFLGAFICNRTARGALRQGQGWTLTKYAAPSFSPVT
jgi:hypothetical protein